MIDWLRLAVTFSTAERKVQSSVARSALPALPLMELVLANKQKNIEAGDLPGWNGTSMARSSMPGQPAEGLAGGTTNTILQSLQLLIQESQT
jgi:hypothetical protein